MHTGEKARLHVTEWKDPEAASTVSDGTALTEKLPLFACPYCMPATLHFVSDVGHGWALLIIPAFVMQQSETEARSKASVRNRLQLGCHEVAFKDQMLPL